MFSLLRRHLSYANVAATTALLFAMAGSAVAASHYLINSTRQINPKVLKALRGNGKTGPQGAIGAQGPAGAPGADGQPGGPGAVGPTFSAHAGRGLPIPAELGGLSVVQTLVVNLPSPGNLMISGSFYGVLKCGSGLGGCERAQVVLAVDGTVVPDSERLLGEFIEGSTVPASGDQTFSTSGRLPGVSAGTHTITLETGDVQPKGAGGKLTPLMVGAEDAAIDATLTG